MLSLTNRFDAIRFISIQKTLLLSFEALVDWALYYFYLDEENVEFYFLPEKIKNRLQECDPDELKESPDRILSPIIPLLASTVILEKIKKHSDLGIAKDLQELGLQYSPSEKTVLSLYACPCCGYSTIQDWHDICDICYWQDDGLRDLDVLSSANQKTLFEARSNFENNENSQINTINQFQSSRYYHRSKDWILERDKNNFEINSKIPKDIFISYQNGLSKKQWEKENALFFLSLEAALNFENEKLIAFILNYPLNSDQIEYYLYSESDKQLLKSVQKNSKIEPLFYFRVLNMKFRDFELMNNNKILKYLNSKSIFIDNLK